MNDWILYGLIGLGITEVIYLLFVKFTAEEIEDVSDLFFYKVISLVGGMGISFMIYVLFQEEMRKKLIDPIIDLIIGFAVITGIILFFYLNIKLGWFLQKKFTQKKSRRKR